MLNKDSKKLDPRKKISLNIKKIQTDSYELDACRDLET